MGHSEHIDIMEPTGASHTRRKLSDSVFTMDSRAHKDKRVAGGARSFYSGLHLETRTDGSRLEAECKFGTNITSRQHERQNFIWKATLEVCQDGTATIESSAKTLDFEYVARRLKPKPAARKKAPGLGQPRVSRAKASTPSDSDDEMGEMSPYPSMVQEPAMRQRSTRGAAKACLEKLPGMVDEEEMPQRGGYDETFVASGQRPQAEFEPYTNMARQQFNPYGSSNMSGNASGFWGSERPTAEDPHLRESSWGGRNLSRVDSIEAMMNSPRGSGLSLDRGTGSKSYLLSQCESEGDLRLAPSNSGLGLRRTGSSMMSLSGFSDVGDDDLTAIENGSAEPEAGAIGCA